MSRKTEKMAEVEKAISPQNYSALAQTHREKPSLFSHGYDYGPLHQYLYAKGYRTPRIIMENKKTVDANGEVIGMDREEYVKLQYGIYLGLLADHPRLYGMVLHNVLVKVMEEKRADQKRLAKELISVIFVAFNKHAFSFSLPVKARAAFQAIMFGTSVRSDKQNKTLEELCRKGLGQYEKGSAYQEGKRAFSTAVVITTYAPGNVTQINVIQTLQSLGLVSDSLSISGTIDEQFTVLAEYFTAGVDAYNDYIVETKECEDAKRDVFMASDEGTQWRNEQAEKEAAIEKAMEDARVAKIVKTPNPSVRNIPNVKPSRRTKKRALLQLAGVGDYNCYGVWWEHAMSNWDKENVLAGKAWMENGYVVYPVKPIPAAPDTSWAKSLI